MRILQPPAWPRPRGYSNGVSARGRLVLTAGVVGWDEAERFASHDLGAQFAQALRNVRAILAEDGAGPEHVVRMTWYVVDINEYRFSLAEIGAAWKEVMGRNFPAMAVVQVTALVEPAARIEIETTAVVAKW
jgi:enamine deaminase RidA (YjgF/YER057c/UK114 family)